MPSLSTIPSYLQVLWKRLLPTKFITIHYTYFVLTCLVSAIVLWGASTPRYSLPFIDALFLTVSAMTLAGLNTVNLSELNTFQQFVLFLLIMLGSTVFVSVSVVFIRRRAFEKAFAHIIDALHKAKRTRGRSPISSTASISRSKFAQKRNTNTRLEVDGVVVRGRAIIAEQSIDHHTINENPGNHPQMELLIEEKQEQESIKSQNCSYGKRPSQLDQSVVLDSKGDVQKDPEDPSTIPSDDPNIYSIDQVDRSEAITSLDRGSLWFVEPMSEGRPQLFSVAGAEAQTDLPNHPITTQSLVPIISSPSNEVTPTLHILRGETFGRNSQLTMLTSQERDKVGSVEFRALRLLEAVIILYFVLFQLFGCIGLGAWIAFNDANVALSNGLNPWWVGAFNAVSAFNNSGMSLLDANMTAFQSAYYVLITMSLLILAGNTCYPVFLRSIFWVLWKLTPEGWTDSKVALKFVLEHPRRVYTNMFPTSHTCFLLGTIVVLNMVDWVAFEILNIGNPYVESISTNDRIIDGLFQAFAVRSGGFYVVQIGSIAIGVQVLYVLMMYISVYPVTMTIRNSILYEERSVGIYTQDESAPSKAELIGPLRWYLTNNTFFTETGAKSKSHFLQEQIRSQLAHDLWFICLAVLFIVTIEGSQFATDPVSYSVFNVIFEVVSGYGSVGISVGLPGTSHSFCGGWHTLSKLILCAVMLRGRHRGLPVAIDKAVLLPSKPLADAGGENIREKPTEQPCSDLESR